jgi:hypothetical protein
MSSSSSSRAVVLRVAAQPQKRKKQQKKSKPGRSNASRSMGPYQGFSDRSTELYCKSLVDPFEFVGPKLGWGCMTPSSVNTAYLRIQANTNADGTAAFVAGMASKTLLYTYFGGAAVAGIGSISAASDATAISGNFSAGRCISLGIRAIPSVATTAAPGYVFGGAFPAMSESVLTSLSVNDLLAFPTTEFLGTSLGGASVTGRPVDANTFTFIPQVVNATGFPAADPNLQYFALPYIVFSGLPASSPVMVEVVMNFEALPLVTHLNSTLGTGSKNAGTGESTLADRWASASQMWSSIRDILPTPARALEGMASIDATFPALRRGARRIVSRGLGNMAFGYPRPIANLLE